MNNSNTNSALSLYWGYSIGGVGKYGVLLDKAARNAGVGMQHVCIRGADWQVDKQTLSDLGAVEFILSSRADLSWIWKLCRFIRSKNPELIITHGFNGHFIARIMQLIGCHKGSFICSYHGLYHPTTPARKILAPIFNGFTEWHIKHSRATVAVAEHSRKYLVRKGVGQELVEVIHNGITELECDAGARVMLRSEFGFTDDHIVFGVASRLDPVKGIECLIEAFSNVVAKSGNARLLIIGTGTVESQLRSQAVKLGIEDKIVFTGFRSDIAECLMAFDVFVLPSLAEYHSIALLEAMRAGKAIVATDVGGNTESVSDGIEAIIVRASDAVGLEKALVDIMQDAHLRARLGSAARRRFCAEFTEDVMLEKTGVWLKRLLLHQDIGATA